MKQVMIDLETLGNGKDKCIVQIGACYFDLKTGEIGETFKVNVNAASHEKYGAKLDASTVYFWLSQSPTAIASILAEPRLDIVEAFNQLNDFLVNAKEIWSHATFDFVTITETFKQLAIPMKFHYRTARDIRTLVSLSNLTISKIPREGTHHDGLDDSIHQVKYCHEAYKKLKGLK